MNVFRKALVSESGAVHALPLFLIIAAVGVISYLLISTTAPAGGLFGKLNPKPASNAASGVTLGSSWSNLTSNLAGMSSSCGNLAMITQIPGTSMVLASVVNHGLWNIDSSGTSWVHLGDGTGSTTITSGVNWVVPDPLKASTFWLSGSYGDSPYITTDSGNTFRRLGNLTHQDHVSVDFTDPNRQTMLVGGHEQKQTVWKSSDGGTNWTNVGANLPAGTGFSNLPQVIDTNTYVTDTNASWAGGTPGIYRTTDGGQSWALVSNLNPGGEPVTTTNGTIFYVDGGSLDKSTDSGITWTQVGGNLSGYSVTELPDGRLVDLSGTSIVISSDNGQTWTSIGAPTTPYQAAGLTYNAGKKAFYIWHGDCGNTVLSDAIEKLDADFGFANMPTVSFTSPTIYQSFITPATVNISVNASPKGTGTSISKVVLTQGTTTLATLTTAPYNFTWSNIIQGSYLVTATATDNLGNIGTASMTVNVTTPNPVILGVSSSNITSNSATINWSTDKVSDSQVDYGTTTSYGSSSALNSTQVINHTINLTGLTSNTTYHYRVDSKNAAGLTQSTDHTFKTGMSSNLVAPWHNQDIGSVSLPGSSNLNSGVFSIQGSGDDIWNSADAFQYAYQSITGDGTVIARVSSINNTDGWAKAGVMIRESLAAGSSQASVFVTPSNGISMQFRNGTGTGANLVGNSGSGTAPMWVKITRAGNVFTGYQSSDGINWTQLGTTTVTMAATVNIGLAVTAHNNSLLNTSIFDNVSIPTPSPTPGTCPKASLGDTDCDGVIGIFDFNNLVTNFNKTGVGLSGGDLDGNGKVDIFDFNTLVTNFGH